MERHGEDVTISRSVDMSVDKDAVNMELNSSKVKKEVEENVKVAAKENVKVDLDTILISEVGQFGRFQVRVLMLAAIAALFSASNSEYNFTAARINTRCLIPQCEDSNTSIFAPPWLELAIPTSGGSFDSCKRFASTGEGSGTCVLEDFDHNTLVPCKQHMYENTHTVVYDFELACKEWRRSLTGFSRTLGTFLSLPLTGLVSDRWGRRTALALNAFTSAWVGLARRWAASYPAFLTLEVVEAVFGSGVFSCAYILVLEVVGPEYRVVAGGILTSSFALGQMCLGLVAWAVPHWRDLTLTLYIPQLLTFSYFWILSESVRWYLSKDRYNESEVLLKDIARVNRKQLSEDSLSFLRVTAENDKKRKAIEDAERALEPWLPVLVFRHKQILIRCMVLPVWWITTTLVYYGLSINSVLISGNKYVNYVAVAAVEIPGFWLSVLLLGRAGRRPVLMGAFWMCAACQAAYVFMPSGNYVSSLAVYLVGKCSIAAVVTAIYVYTTELFPTRYRHSLFGFCSMLGRVGSITAPLTPAMGAATFAELPFVLFGVFALVSGLLILLMPETLGAPLPDSMQDAEDIRKRRRT